ncbi:MAG TPA: hypothetical protein VIO33_23145 [Burkholderiaceae bacterium]
MSETKTLLHADPKTETYSYKIEETAEHLTVVRLVRNADHRWHYHVTAERLIAVADHPAGDTVQGDADGFATSDEAIAAARDHARTLLAG